MFVLSPLPATPSAGHRWTTGLASFPADWSSSPWPDAPHRIARSGDHRQSIAAGFAAHLAAYCCSCASARIPANPAVILPTVLLGGLGFALAYGSLNVAATAGVDSGEQGLGGLVTSSLQFGGALVLGIATAVSRAATSGTYSNALLLNGYRAALVVSREQPWPGWLAPSPCPDGLRPREP